MLESWGCQVTLAHGAQTACFTVRHLPPQDLIVSDFRLPGHHNGVVAIRMLRAMVGHDMAACVISGDTDAAVRQQAQQAGLVLLQKPVRPAKLRNVLRSAVRAKILDNPRI